ncbi:baseplate megatron protein TIM-barrel domain-containing protein [Xanthomonas sacchari]
MRYQPLDLLGGFAADHALEWCAEDCINWIPEVAETQGTRTRMKFVSRPGMRPLVDLANGPIRGLHNVEGALFAVSGNKLYQVSSKAVATARGIIPGVTRVQMAHNQITGGNQLLVANGQGGYVWDTVAANLARITDDGYPGAKAAAYIDSYLAQVEPFGRFWFHSQLADAKNYNTLDRYESEASPDKIVTLVVSQKEVVVFNETTTEFFYNSGARTTTFKSKGVVVERGCASAETVVVLDNSPMWLGNDGVVYRLDGYQAVPISNGPLQDAIRGQNWSQAFAFAWEGSRHKVYYLTLPDGRTYGYDVVTKLWHRACSFGLERWRLSHLVRWNGMWIGGDSFSGQLWVLDEKYGLDGGQPIVCERFSQSTTADMNALEVPYLELLVRTGAASQEDPEPSLDISGVTLIPSTGSFAYSTVPHTRTVGTQQPVVENQHTGTGKTDVIVALEQLFTSLPTCNTVSLVVSWFGDDLRAGQCQIKPRLAVAPGTQTSVSWSPSNWQVAGVTASTATLVTFVSDPSGGHSVYGSTPSDDSIVQVIQYLRAQGKRIVFYPFVLMDIPTGNSLPNPYSGSSQPVNPWRGRVTCYPAPGQSGTPDGTSAAGTQVDTFFTRQWGFENFIAHYRDLCASAGGVDVFLIGSEMVGITQVRSSATVYPAIAHLRTIAAGVKSAMPTALVSYAADWTEYHSRQYPDGTLNFHLDPLWADSNIDFVGIDNYLPIADVRADDNPALIYNIPYLQSNIEGGELWDWYYVDRANNVKAPITDGAYGKPWVYRQKDIRGWWSNTHVARAAGVETTATAWVPGSKPIWFTEYGCPAINRGPNQPNVFFDPNSSESTLPYFSTGLRDDLAQRSYYEATIAYWREHGGAMLSTENMIAWTWDARPYPQFPSLTSEWGDYGNYPRGHWLQGRYRTQAELPDRAIEICYSDDGRNYTNWIRRDLGGVGEYAKRIKINNLGHLRNRVWRIRTSSPIPTELEGAVANIRMLK